MRAKYNNAGNLVRRSDTQLDPDKEIFFLKYEIKKFDDLREGKIEWNAVEFSYETQTIHFDDHMALLQFIYLFTIKF